MSVINSLIYSPPWCKCVVWMLVAPWSYWKAFHLTMSFDLSHTVWLGAKFFQSQFFLRSRRVYLNCSLELCGVSGMRAEKCQGDFLWLRRGWEGLACWWTSPRDVGCSLVQGSLLPSPFTKREQKCSDKIRQIKYQGLYFRAKWFNNIFINGFGKSCLCPFPSASLFCYSYSHENPSDTTPPRSLRQCEGVSL